MYLLLPAVLALGLAGPVLAQGAKPATPATPPPQQKKTEADDLKKKYDAKLAEPFVKKADWITDYEAALAASKKTGKMIFGYFSRSYAP